MEMRTLRGDSGGRARPRQYRRNRTRARQRRKVPRPAAAHAGQHRRLYRIRSAASDAIRHDRHRVRRLRHPDRARNDRRRAVEHQPDRALSRRRPARGDLSDGADHRGRGARTRHRSDRIAPAQHHPAGGDAVQGSAWPDLRLRRVRQEHGDRARGLRLCRLRRPPGGVARCRQAARHRAGQRDRAGGRAGAGICRNPVPAQRQRDAAAGNENAWTRPRDLVQADPAREDRHRSGGCALHRRRHRPRRLRHGLERLALDGGRRHARW